MWLCDVWYGGWLGGGVCACGCVCDVVVWGGRRRSEEERVGVGGHLGNGVGVGRWVVWWRGGAGWVKGGGGLRSGLRSGGGDRDVRVACVCLR